MSLTRSAMSCPTRSACSIVRPGANAIRLPPSMRAVTSLDRRRHRVELTKVGAQALTRAERAQETIEDEILKALDPQERAMLWRLLSRALYGAEPARIGEEPEPAAAAAAGVT